jgi:hypothetical protein
LLQVGRGSGDHLVVIDFLIPDPDFLFLNEFGQKTGTEPFER